MPSHARRVIFNPHAVGYYHCIARCVRRAYLCGYDEFSEKDFSYRRNQIVERMNFLSRVFYIEIGHYAIMANHLHLVMKNRPDQVLSAENEEIVDRWLKLFPQNSKTQKDKLRIESLRKSLAEDDTWCLKIRERLSDISWYMKCLCEPIARKANKEDNVTGHFWEGRFKCIALLDDTAVKNVGLYVDLNPFRAGIASTIDESDFTSLKERSEHAICSDKPRFLAPFADKLDELSQGGLVPFIQVSTEIYLELALEQMSIENSLIKQMVKACPTAMGSRGNMKQFATKAGLKWIKGTVDAKY